MFFSENSGQHCERLFASFVQQLILCVVDHLAIRETSIVHHEWKAVLPEVIPVECRAGTLLAAGQTLWIAKIELATGVLTTGNTLVK